VYGDFEFVGPVTFVGPCLDERPKGGEFDWGLINNPDWPTIYVSIGTVLDEIHHTIFTKVVEAFADSELNVIANTAPDLLNHWPENFVVQKLCPQIDILEKVDAVISHCGFNTMNEALYFDKPIVGIPLAWDQSSNADLLVSHGCGVKLRHRRLNGARLRDAVFEVLNQPLYVDKARILGQSLRSLGGSEVAADMIEQRLLGSAQ
jgi:MGT family glycosyltransferase